VGKYSDEQRATALAALQANGGNLSRTSRDTGIPFSTIKRWRDEPDPRLADLGDRKKVDLSEKLEEIAYKLADAVEGKIPEANLQHVATSLGIAIDKLRLLRGEATDISEVRSSDAKRELADRLTKLTQRVPEAPSEPN
jgi:transposase-like protein